MPKCKYCDLELSPKVLKIHENWCRKQTSEPKEGEEETSPKKKRPEDNNEESVEGKKEFPETLDEFTTREAPDLINKCNDQEILTSWLKGELDGKNRQTIIDPLKSKIKSLNSESGDE